MEKCKDCPVAEQSAQHHVILLGDPEDMENKPGLVNYMRELKVSFASMQKALWVIAIVLILMLFGFAPKEIAEKVFHIAM